MSALATLAEDWPFPLLLIGESGTVSWANQAAQAWLGQSIRALSGKSPWDSVEVDADTQAILSKCAESGSPLTMRSCAVRPTGQARGQLRGQSSGQAKGQAEQICDLTAYPTEAGIGLSFLVVGPKPRESRMGGQLVSGMGRMIAHELKNPLAGIKGAAQLLRDDIPTEEGQSLLDLISSEIDRIRRLADRMETLGDAPPDGGRAVNAHELLRRARQIIQSANPNVLFTERYDPSLPHVMGDADTLMQALLNLIKNASEAIEDNQENAEIILETRSRSGTSRRGENALRSLPVEIRIIDNGPGISAELKDQIFQPFVTDKPEGQGLGLALVSKVARAHGGLIEVSSKPGRTVFSLLLPTPDGDLK